VLIGLLTLGDVLLARAPAPLKRRVAAAPRGAGGVDVRETAEGGGDLLREIYFRCLFDIATPQSHGADAPPKCDFSCCCATTDARACHVQMQELAVEAARVRPACHTG
jgi:hypothetical protein